MDAHIAHQFAVVLVIRQNEVLTIGSPHRHLHDLFYARPSPEVPLSVQLE